MALYETMAAGGAYLLPSPKLFASLAAQHKKKFGFCCLWVPQVG